jgi:5'(3')-deoxyribonucleotidase
MREPQLLIATGKKGVGKTWLTIKFIMNYIRPNRTTKRKARKVLIYDVNMEYTQFKAIAVEDVKRFTWQKKCEVRRVLPYNNDGTLADIDQMVEILNQILADYAGGLLVMEDINRYMIDTKTKEIVGTMATNRHRDMDIICHLQSLSPMTTRMWQNTTVVRFHYQMDDIDRYKNRIPNFEMFKIAQLLVNAQHKKGNERFYCYVSNDNVKISGQFSKRSFQSACIDYINLSPSKITNTVKRLGHTKETDGRKKAIKFMLEELMKYYGN